MTAFIDHNRKILFVHTPKTGGTSITDCFVGLEPASQAAKIFGIDVSHIEYVSGAHKQVEEIMSQEDRKNYFSFSVMREPYDWLISLFEFESFNNKDRDPIPEHYISLDSFIDNFYSLGHKPQTHWFTNNGVCQVDKVVDFSRLSEEISILKERFSITKPLRMINRRKSNPNINEYSSMITDNARRLLRDDIDFYRSLINE